MSDPRPPPAHVTVLDGLRGVAVLVVLVYHFAWTFSERGPVTATIAACTRVGWVGVDLFFVLSGYLITRGLVARSDLPHRARLARFWARRFLRIFPLYYLVLLVGTAVALLVHAETPGAAYWLYLQNYTLPFDAWDRVRWTSHLWSLAVEEQFYLGWPLIILLRRPGGQAALAMTILVTATVLRVVLLFHLPGLSRSVVAKLVYCATLTHADGLVLGALVAIAHTHAPELTTRLTRRFGRSVAGLAYCGVVFLAVVTRGFNQYDRRVAVLGYPLVAVAFAVTVGLAVDGALPPRMTSALSRSWVTSVGRVSYAMYLFHWPLVALLIAPVLRLEGAMTDAQVLTFGGLYIVVGTAGTYAAARVSFVLVESPFLRLKQRFAG
jgi:peptidoglycan/LPS O-acetylase OafA/YrhL